MPLSAWLIGSYPSLPAQGMEVTANASQETITVAAGDYYLDDWSGTRSYLAALQTALETHTQITTATVWLGRDRLVHFAFDTATAIDFTDTEGRDLIGMNGNLASTTADDADTVSPYLWVPDRPENALSAALGRDGDPVYDTVVSATGGLDANLVSTGFDTRTFNDFDFRFVPTRYFDSGSDVNNGGEWRAFHEVVVRRFRRFKLYRQSLHDETDDTAVGLLGSNQLGPYRMRHEGNGPIRFVNEREIGFVERLHRVRLPVIQVPEYE